MRLPEHCLYDLIHLLTLVSNTVDKYIRKLNETGIHITMTKNGDPLENAIAEPVKGILESEWLNERTPKIKLEWYPC